MSRFEMGGVETFILRLIGFLQSRGHSVAVLATHSRGECWSELGGRHVDAEALPIERSLCGVTHAIRIAKRLSTFDLVVLNHVRYAQAALGALPDDVGVVPILHNDIEDIYRVGCGNPEAWNVAVAVSPQVQARAQHRAEGRRVLCITPGVEQNGDHGGERCAPAGSLRLLYVGRLLDTQKRVFLLPDILQAALKQGVNATLTVVGDGPDSAALRHKVARYGLEQRVEFTGSVAPRKVYSLLSAHHVLLMPSAHEGFGLVLAEAEACGCVPVASRLVGVTDAVVVHGRTGYLVEPGDVSQFARRTVELGSDPELWTAMSREGIRLANERFSCDVMGESYLQLFGEVLAGKYPLTRSRRTLPAVDMSLLGWRGLVPSFVRLLQPDRSRSSGDGGAAGSCR